MRPAVPIAKSVPAIVAIALALSSPAAAAPPAGPSTEAAAALAAAAGDAAAAPALPTLVVRIADAEAKGHVFLSLCTEAEYFVAGGPTCARGTRLDATAPLEWTITDAPAGTYIVRGFHDLDSNGELKTKIFGIPAEPTFASNDARGRRGPPSFEDMAFDLTADGREITLRPIRY